MDGDRYPWCDPCIRHGVQSTRRPWDSIPIALRLATGLVVACAPAVEMRVIGFDDPGATDAPIETAEPPSPTTALPARAAERRRVVVITLDGVRWQDVLPGGAHRGRRRPRPLMPALQELVRERGVALGGERCEHDVRVSGPAISLPGYFELFSGGAAASCVNNTCERIDADTFVDDVRAAAGRSGDVAVFASWRPYERAAARDPAGLTLSAGRGPAALAAGQADAVLQDVLADSANARPYPGSGDYRADVLTTRAALRYFELVRPRLLVVGLGDTDEHAHRGERAKYDAALRAADEVVRELAATVDSTPSLSETTVIVTTDHGRSKTFRGHGPASPESRSVFVAAFGAHVRRRGFACPARPIRLGHVAAAVRTFAGIPREDDATSPLVPELHESDPAHDDAR
jgi:hypothetical protein